MALLARLLLLAATLLMGIPLWATEPDVDCSSFGLGRDVPRPLAEVTIPPTTKCHLHHSHGFTLPDPKCTPGAVDPALTLRVLQAPGFTTKCVRDGVTTPHEKASTYSWYGVEKPDSNNGAAQVCELDHLVSLELGGADSLDNIWPQCGPDNVVRRHRFFVMKDLVENFVAKQVREGIIDLSDAQQRIASDWTQFLDEAIEACGARCSDLKSLEAE